jgi:hypothetical protein
LQDGTDSKYIGNFPGIELKQGSGLSPVAGCKSWFARSLAQMIGNFWLVQFRTHARKGEKDFTITPWLGLESNEEFLLKHNQGRMYLIWCRCGPSATEPFLHLPSVQ